MTDETAQQRWDRLATPLQKSWLAMLRSGEYTQARGRLKRISTTADWQLGFCCLGLACQNVLGDPDSLEEEENGVIGVWKACAAGMPDSVTDAMQFFGALGEFKNRDATAEAYGWTALSTENDSGLSFNEIADLAVKHAPSIFKNFSQETTQ